MPALDSASCSKPKGRGPSRPLQRPSLLREPWPNRGDGPGRVIPLPSVPSSACAVDGGTLPAMPSKRRSGSHLLEDALGALSRALSESGAPWMIIGGIAIIARGVRRFTTDIDAAVRGDAVTPEKLLGVLAHRKIAPRIPDALAFARENLVLLLRHEPTKVELDVSFAWSAFEHDALAAATLTDFGKLRVPMCAPDDLVVFKAIAARAKDIDDAEALLLLYPEIDLSRVRRRVKELAALAEAPELVETFDRTARRVRQVQAGRILRAPKKKKRPGLRKRPPR
jgi:hypothetical protein